MLRIYNADNMSQMVTLKILNKYIQHRDFAVYFPIFEYESRSTAMKPLRCSFKLRYVITYRNCKHDRAVLPAIAQLSCLKSVLLHFVSLTAYLFRASHTSFY